MTIGTTHTAYFIKVAAVAFVTIVVLAVFAGMVLSFLSTGARVSVGAFFLQAEDFFWIAVISVAIGVVALAVRLVRRKR